MATAARSVRLVDASNNVLSDGYDSENEPEPTSQAANQADLEQIYAKEKKKRPKRQQLKPSQLITALASIPHGFSAKLNGRVTSEKSVKSAAQYANTLMQLYADFVTDLPAQPDLAKVQKIGSSREVRDACKLQRILVTRNPYLESVLGKDATNNLLHQLDEYETEQRTQELDEINGSNTAEAGDLATPHAPSGEFRAQPRVETENQLAPAPVAPMTNGGPTVTTNAVDDDSEDEFEFDVAPSKPRLTILEDSDEEEEEELDDPTRKRKRIIPEDDPEPATDTSRDAMDVDVPTHTNTLEASIGHTSSDLHHSPTADASGQQDAHAAREENVLAEGSSAPSILDERAPAIVPEVVVHEDQQLPTDKDSEPCTMDDQIESNVRSTEKKLLLLVHSQFLCRSLHRPKP